MNHSIYGADRLTHLKIVVVGLLFAIGCSGLGMFAHVRDLDLGTAQLVKAGQPTVISGAARASSAKYKFSLKHERGSTSHASGQSIGVLA